MAKESMIARDTKRKKLVDHYAAKRAELKKKLETQLGYKNYLKTLAK